MMAVDVDVAVAGECEVHEAVGRHEVEHMVKEADARVDDTVAVAIEIEDELDARLCRLALDGRCADTHALPSVNALK